MRRRPADGDLDEFGRALAVAHDELAEPLGERRQDGRHGRVVLVGRVVGDGRGVRRRGGRSVGEECHRVVGARVAVDGDGVEGLVDRVGEEGLCGARGDGRVGTQNPQEGRHVGVDHACSLGHAGQRVLCPPVRGRGERECRAEEFGERVGRADGLRRGEPGVVVVVEVLVGRGDPGEDFLDR